MFEYWETVRGLKRGDKPNPTVLFYAAYVRWCRATCEGAPLTTVEFRRAMAARGYKKAQHGARPCWLLNKYVVPKSSLKT